MKRYLGLPLAMIMMLVLMGCTGTLTGDATPGTANPTGSSEAITQTVEETQPVPALTPAGSDPSESDAILTVWVPDEFDPASGTQAGTLLNDRLNAFMIQNPGVTIDVRVKATSGPAGLLDSLTATSSAAAEALPDLIALSSADMEVAALKGLLASLDSLTAIPDDPDWYDYARVLGTVQNSTFGLPFAGDALVMLYRPSLVSRPPVDWDTLLTQTGPLAFAAMDPEALLTLSLYQAQGGRLADERGKPALDVDPLTNVLSLYQRGLENNLLPVWIGDLETDDQVWKAYQEQSAHIAVTWISHYLVELPPDTIAQTLPGISGSNSTTVATGWLWALGNPDSEQQALSVKLAEFLVDSQFLASWNQASGTLPTRPSVLAAWTDQTIEALLSQVVISAQARPKMDIMVSLGSVLRDATLTVLDDGTDPQEAAQAASDQLNEP